MKREEAENKIAEILLQLSKDQEVVVSDIKIDAYKAMTYSNNGEISRDLGVVCYEVKIELME